MNDISAAIGLVQLSKLDAMNARRREIVGMYNNRLADLMITIPRESSNTKSSMHNYVVRATFRDELRGFLKDRGISTGVHYYPINEHNVFSHIESHTPVAAYVWKQMLTLPLYPDLTNDEVDYIIESIEEFYAHIDNNSNLNI